MVAVFGKDSAWHNQAEIIVAIDFMKSKQLFAAIRGLKNILNIGENCLMVEEQFSFIAILITC